MLPVPTLSIHHIFCTYFCLAAYVFMIGQTRAACLLASLMLLFGVIAYVHSRRNVTRNLSLLQPKPYVDHGSNPRPEPDPTPSSNHSETHCPNCLAKPPSRTIRLQPSAPIAGPPTTSQKPRLDLRQDPTSDPNADVTGVHTEPSLIPQYVAHLQPNVLSIIRRPYPAPTSNQVYR